MTDKELKRMISQAYKLPETESEKRFIRKYTQRSNQLLAISLTEFRYMGIRSLLVGIILCGTLFFASKLKNMEAMWIISSITPASSLIPMLLISKSEKYRMDELEMACRFSLSFIRMTRMAILGIFSFLVILTELVITVGTIYSSILEIVMYMLIPYFICIWNGLCITRKFHGMKGTYGVIASSIMSACVPTLIRNIQVTAKVPGFVYVAFLAIVTIGSICEGKKYINERNELSWNLY